MCKRSRRRVVSGRFGRSSLTYEGEACFSEFDQGACVDAHHVTFCPWLATAELTCDCTLGDQEMELAEETHPSELTRH
jgi:hypothetical protein